MFNRLANYGANGRLESENSWTLKSDNKTYSSSNSYVFTDSVTGEYLLGAVGSVTGSTSVSGSSSVTYTRTKNTYQWWDSAQQGTINYRTYSSYSNFAADTSPSTTYNTTFTYDGLGTLGSVKIVDGRPRYVWYRSDGSGQIVRRDEADYNQGPGSESARSGDDPHEQWYRFGGRELGYVGNNGTNAMTAPASVSDRQVVDGTSNGAFRHASTYATNGSEFSQSSSPINAFAQGSAAGSYTVSRAGETLRSVAQSVYGDASLWYKIAEANGMGDDMALAEGQRLTLPAGITRSHFNASTLKPYDTNEAIGNVSPTTPKPKKNNCGVFGQILLAIVAIAVTIIALPAGGLAAGWAGVGQGALAGLAGGVASQTVGVVTGIQEKFDFKGLAMSAIGGGVSAGVGQIFGTGALAGSQIAGDVARGVVTSAVTQGIGVATGLQDKFSWAGVAAAGVMAGVGGAVLREFSKGKYSNGKTPSSDGVVHSNGTWVSNGNPSIGAQFAAAAVSTIAGAATKSAIEGSNFGDNVIALLPDAVGGVVGRALGNVAAEALDKAAARAKGSQSAQGDGQIFINQDYVDAASRSLLTDPRYSSTARLVMSLNPDGAALVANMNTIGEKIIARERSQTTSTSQNSNEHGFISAEKGSYTSPYATSYAQELYVDSNLNAIVYGQATGIFENGRERVTVHIDEARTAEMRDLQARLSAQPPSFNQLSWDERYRIGYDIARSESNRVIGGFALATIGGAATSVALPFVVGSGTFGTTTTVFFSSANSGIGVNYAMGNENTAKTYLTDGALGVLTFGLLKAGGAGLSKVANSFLSRGAGAAERGVVRTNFDVYEVLSEQFISGTSRGGHRAVANRGLFTDLSSDPEFAAMFNKELGADVLAHMKSGRQLLNPPGTVWHHPANNPAAIQLLRSTEHSNPLLQPILHPEGVGGFGTFYGN